MMAPSDSTNVPGRLRRRRSLRGVLSLGVVAAVFIGILPQVADLTEVWDAVTAMGGFHLVVLVVAAGWYFASSALVMQAALPGLPFRHAFAVGQSSTAVAATVPGGSALGVGVTYAMYSSWGRAGGEIALAAVLTGVWHTFTTLGLPVASLLLLALRGGGGAAESTAAAVGVALLVAGAAAFGLALRSEQAARGLLRRTVSLLRDRWQRLTAATIANQLALFAVLALSLRATGTSGDVVTLTEALAAFAVVRLATALPVTPAGLGMVELGLVAALVVAGGPRPQVVAAVLVYRFATLLIQVPIGAISYLLWRAATRRTIAVSDAGLEVGAGGPRVPTNATAIGQNREDGVDQRVDHIDGDFWQDPDLVGVRR